MVQVNIGSEFLKIPEDTVRGGASKQLHLWLCLQRQKEGTKIAGLGKTKASIVPLVTSLNITVLPSSQVCHWDPLSSPPVCSTVASTSGVNHVKGQDPAL